MTARPAAIVGPEDLEPLEPEEFQRVATAIEAGVGRTVVGQHEAVRGALICLMRRRPRAASGRPRLSQDDLARALAGGARP